MNRLFFRCLVLLGIMFFSLCSFSQTPKWQEIYKAKKKDTIYGIAKKFGVTLDELIKANPDMGEPDYVLKKGTQVLIPMPAEPQKTAKPAVQPVDDLTKRAIRVGVMLPLHDVDGDGRRMVEYYRGLLMGCDSLKRMGISTDIHAWNVNIDADIRQTLLDSCASKCDIIFGPLYTRQVKYLADFCNTYKIKLVIPFSINANDVETNSQVFQVYQSAELQNQAAINAFLERFPRHHAVFIDCNDSTSQKGSFTFGLRKQLEARNLSYNITNLKSSEEFFSKAFSREKPNVVVLNTGRSPELNVALAKIDGLMATAPAVSVSLFGYTEWLMYTKSYLNYFHKYETYIPSTFYYNALSPRVTNIENDYRRWFRADMQKALPRFALTGFDHAMFFINGLHRHGKLFNGQKSENKYDFLQTPLKFVRLGEGGMQNKHFMLIHYKNNHELETITY